MIQQRRPRRSDDIGGRREPERIVPRNIRRWVGFRWLMVLSVAENQEA